MNIEREVAYFGGTIETLAGDKWKSLKVMRVPSKGIDGYTYAHEEHSHGVGVAILPYSEGPAGMRVLLRIELVPPWGLVPSLCAITGSWDHEGESFEQVAVRELMEEAGYQVTEEMLDSLGACRLSKGSDTKMMMFGVDVTGLPQGKATGDGSKLEDSGSTKWVQELEAFNCADPTVSVMVGRLHLLQRQGL